MVKILIKHGADVDKQGGSSRKTPLHSAATDSENLAKILIHNGASLKIRNKNGDTPFESALSINRAEVLKVLILHS